ncbi:MAG: hypothetical protein ACK56I_14105, partial [bacterium]
MVTAPHTAGVTFFALLDFEVCFIRALSMSAGNMGGVDAANLTKSTTNYGVSHTFHTVGILGLCIWFIVYILFNRNGCCFCRERADLQTQKKNKSQPKQLQDSFRHMNRG